MTIGTRTAGAWAAGSTSISTNLPTSVAAGDMMVLFVGCKPYNATITDVSGWTRLGTQQTNGTTGAGTDTGSVAWSVFYRQFVNGDAAPTVSITSGNTALACIFGFTKTESAWATPEAYFGADTSSGTGYAATAASSSGQIAAGDYLCSGTILAGNDADLATPTCSATGATIGTVTQAPATNGSTNTGTDCRAGGFYAPVSAGYATADAVVGWTLSANQTGGSALVLVREKNRPTSPTVGTLRTEGQTPKVGQDWTAVPTVGTLVFAGQQPTVETSETEPIIVSPLVGTLRVTGQAPTVSLVNSWFARIPGINTWAPRYQVGGFALSPSVGTLRFVGQEPTVSVSAGADATASPTAGALIFAGQQPTVASVANQTASPSVGALVVAGQQPTVTSVANQSSSPTVGTLRTVGQQPTVASVASQSTSPTVGTLRTVGQQPTVASVASQTASPSVGTLRTVGQQPTVASVASQSVTPVTGTFRFLGQQPLVQSGGGVAVLPTTGTFRFDGQQPIVVSVANQSASPTVGALRFDGQQPTISIDGSATVAPYAGTLRITGLQPQIVVSGAVAQPTGGWAAQNMAALGRRQRRELDEEREREELAERLERVLVDDGVIDPTEAELLRLAGLVAQYAELPNRALRAVKYAERARSIAAVALAQREMARLMEAEELAVMLLLTLD